MGVKIYPEAVIFVSDSQKTDYLMSSPNIFPIGKGQVLWTQRRPGQSSTSVF